MVATSALGNTLEFYDFVICGVFIAKISEVFFPSNSPTVALFASIFAFSAAFFTRPLGAYVFGLIGDKFGRKVALTYSMILMGFPTITIALLPGYATLGILSPIILVFCRMIQGLSTGGEYNGSAIFAIEHSNPKNMGLISGIIGGTCMIGAMIASFAGSMMLQPEMPEWAWRIPFAVGALASFVGFIMRKSAKETDAYLQIVAKKKQQKQPLKAIFNQFPKAFSINMGVGFVCGVLTYTVFGFLTIYMTKFLNVPTAQAIFLNTFGLLGFSSGCVFFGWLSDKITMHRSVYLSWILCSTLSFFGFYLLQQNTELMQGIGQYVIGLYVGSFIGISHAYMQVVFPANIRYTGIAVSFSLGVATSGGTMPSIYTFLTGYLENLYIVPIITSIVLLTFASFSRIYRKNATLYDSSTPTANNNTEEFLVAHEKLA